MRTPTIWAFIVWEATEGSSFAEAIVQAAPASYELLLEGAYDNGAVTLTRPLAAEGGCVARTAGAARSRPVVGRVRMAAVSCRNEVVMV